MKNLYICSVVSLLLFVSTTMQAEDAQKLSQRFGDSVITFLGVEKGTEVSGSDRHQIAVRLRAENIGKRALCIEFQATMKATFELEYIGTYYTPKPFKIRELLPSEKTEGEYMFSVKNGTQPLQLILKPLSQSQTCTRGQDSFSAIWHGADELRFDLSSAHTAVEEQATAPQAQQPETLKARVFLSDKRGGAAKEAAVKAFFEHCPQAFITTNKGAANYFVELAPASLKQTKNSVVVTNIPGDVVYSGATMSLGNAAKDACIAIVKDFGTSAGKNPPP
jgi:hypothetical protein